MAHSFVRSFGLTIAGAMLAGLVLPTHAAAQEKGASRTTPSSSRLGGSGTGTAANLFGDRQSKWITVCRLPASTGTARTFVPPRGGLSKGLSKQARRLPGVPIEITFVDFPGEVEESAFRYAADLWSSGVYIPGPVEIEAVWTSLPAEQLGVASIVSVALDFFHQPVTRYPYSFLNALFRSDLEPDGPEVRIEINSTVDWYLGTDGNTPDTQFDLVTVAMHEIGHALGITDSYFVDETTGRGTWGHFLEISDAEPLILDQYVQDVSGNYLTDGSVYTRPSDALGDVLQGGELYFDGPETRRALGEERIHLFAPPVYDALSSVAHLDEDTYPAGHVEALMTPGQVRGEAHHDPGPATLGLLRDLGWGRVAYLAWTEYTGAGSATAWVDYDGDGDLDAFLASGGNQGDTQNNLLLTNDGIGNLSSPDDPGPIHTDVTNTTAATWGDYDNDGHVDVFLTSRFGEPNVLYRSNGDGTFERIAEGEIVTDGGDSVGASWGDYDGDGYLDLFVANLDGPDFLYRNDGDGTFTPQLDSEIVSERHSSFSGSWADYDDDGDLDLFVARAFFLPSALFRNDGSGAFTDVTDDALGGVASEARGASWGDYDGDGDLDLFVSVTGMQPNRLYRNAGDGTFEPVVDSPVVTDIGDSQGSGWADIDNDGDLDLLVANASGEENFLYVNDGDGSFARHEERVPIVTDAFDSFGVSWGDFDRDGDVEAAIAAHNLTDEPTPLVYMSFDITGRSWLNVRPVGTISNRSGIGAKVRVRASISGEPRWQMAEISGQTGRGSQNALEAAFGLGDAAGVDSIVVEWPSGLVDVLTGIEANQFLSVTEGEGPVPAEPPSAELPRRVLIHQNYPNPFNPATTIGFDLPQAGTVRLAVYDVLGREVAVLVDGYRAAGRHDVRFDAAGLPSGAYLYRLEAAGRMQTKRMVLSQ